MLITKIMRTEMHQAIVTVFYCIIPVNEDDKLYMYCKLVTFIVCHKTQENTHTLYCYLSEDFHRYLAFLRHPSIKMAHL